MLKQLTSLLKKAQLKEEEIKIYLVLLKLKQATATQICDFCGFHFVNVYRILKRLKNMGLIKSCPLNNKESLFKPLSLQTLLDKIQKEKKQLIELEQGLKYLDPFLSFMNIEEDEEDPIEIQCGIDAMKQAYLNLTNLSNEEMLPMGNVNNFLKLSGFSVDCPEERNFIQQRLRRGIYVRMMNPYNEIGEILKSRDSFEKRTMKLTRKQPIHDNFLVITEDRSTLFICDESDPKVLITKQPELLKMQRDQFNYYWNS